ncbi:MAG: amino acid permease [Verrucomicrobiota bacterium]|nr:amino acid permease [Verrucomicrobiota bacterium]
MTKKIPFFSLIILIIAAIDNIRNLPATALFGSSLVFFFVLSAIVFLIPISLMSAELSAAFPEKGGVYQWINRAFGKKWAMAAIWLQWINTMVWYPTILSFIAGTLSYLIDPALAQNKAYLLSVILVIFWGLTWVNLKGIHVSTMINNVCATIGTVVPMIFLIALGAMWFFSGKPIQVSFTRDAMIPSFTNLTSWSSLIAIMASFLGMELSGVHVNDIYEPQKNFPKAVFLASLFIFLTMLFGSLSIAFVVPTNEINLVSGVMQVFTSFFYAFGLQALIPLLTLMIVIGSTGTMINWLISPAKGLLHAAEFGFLPPFFSRKNKAGVASNILIAQAVVVSLVCLVFLLEPTINAFYWFLTALSTELYMIMYVMIFCAGVRLHYKYIDRPSTFKIPGNGWGMWATALLGLVGCLLTIIISFLPPDTIITTPGRYLSMICIGNLVSISPLFLFYWYQRKTS